MCSVLLLNRVLSGTPLVVIFVRDEALARGGSPPEVRADAPGVLAPRDPLAGGTWFGVSARGFLAGLVNRKGDPIPADANSRGQLLLAALRENGAAAALRRVAEEVTARPFGGCRVFAGDGKELAWVDAPVAAAPSPPRRLAPGAWLFSHAHQPGPPPPLFLPQAGETAEAWLRRAWGGIAAHEPQGAPLCHHGHTHGSVDATLAALGTHGEPVLFRHACGPPCGGEPEDFSHLLAFLRPEAMARAGPVRGTLESQ